MTEQYQGTSDEPLCPKCGDDEEIRVTFTGTCKLAHDGSEDDGDHEYDDTSDAYCGSCGHSGKLAEFWGEPIPTPPAPSYALSLDEHATVLAALRFYQEKGQGEPDNRSDAIHEIATCGGDAISLDASAIDSLCERLNAGAVQS